MKKCVKCGCTIIPGENGCTMFDDCFVCRGGLPRYKIKVTNTNTNIVIDYDNNAENLIDYNVGD